MLIRKPWVARKSALPSAVWTMKKSLTIQNPGEGLVERSQKDVPVLSTLRDHVDSNGAPERGLVCQPPRPAYFFLGCDHLMIAHREPL